MTREQYLEHLRDALNHLYDPERLRRSPLASLFAVADRFDSASALQSILIDAIAALKPAPGQPHQSVAWQIYEPLFYRYVEQLSAEEVADQLGVGTRHLRRWQAIAQEALADRLTQEFNLAEHLQPLASAAAHGSAASPLPALPADAVPGGAAAGAGASLNDALSWVKEARDYATDLAEALPPVLELARKLAGRYAVELAVSLPGELPRIAAGPVALRQTLINLLSAVIPRAAGGRLSIVARPSGANVEIQVHCTGCAPGRGAAAQDEADNLKMACQLADLCGCTLELSSEEGIFDAALSFPAFERIPVLAIDDSQDALQLLERYAAGTRYRLAGTRDPEAALALAAKVGPRIILLDVMMPLVDGWELLGRLRAHPLTAETPIIICTILAQRDLALLLGANDFLRKPFTRADFLAALDRRLVPAPAPR